MVEESRGEEAVGDACGAAAESEAGKDLGLALSWSQGAGSTVIAPR